MYVPKMMLGRRIPHVFGFRRMARLEILSRSGQLTVGQSSRAFSSTSFRSIIPGAPLPFDDPLGEEEDTGKKKKNGKDSSSRGYDILLKCVETAGIMVASLSMLGLAGLIYHRSYKEHALTKMANAFTEGNPAFELSMHNRSVTGGDIDEHW